ncbi:hypothetical protein BDF19DRAFT_421989 [Syncephalis fuscata]|nr:hypothetical protein BDF19DRAFT_421989 [Syncephalis fuscata]
MLFQFKYLAIIAACTLELTLSNCGLATPSFLRGSNYKLIDLPKLSPGQPVLDQKDIILDKEFSFSGGVFRAYGKYRSDPAIITCGNGNKDSEDKTIQVYKSIKSFRINRLLFPEKRYHTLYPVRQFALADGVCYVARNQCTVTLRQHLDTVAHYHQNDRDQYIINLPNMILDGLEYLIATGWFVNPSLDDICGGDNIGLVIAGYSNAEQVTAKIDDIGDIIMPDGLKARLEARIKEIKEVLETVLYHPESFSLTGKYEPLPLYDRHPPLGHYFIKSSESNQPPIYQPSSPKN